MKKKILLGIIVTVGMLIAGCNGNTHKLPVDDEVILDEFESTKASLNNDVVAIGQAIGNVEKTIENDW